MSARFILMGANNGERYWINTISTLVGKAVRVDSSNKIYILCGTSSADVVQQYNINGVIQWQKQFSGYGTNENLTISPSNNACIGSSLPGFFEINQSGSLVSQYNYIRGSGPYGVGGRFDSTGNMYICGAGRSGTSGSTYAALVKIDSSKNVVWNKYLIGGLSALYNVCVDSSKSNCVWVSCSRETRTYCGEPKIASYF